MNSEKDLSLLDIGFLERYFCADALFLEEVLQNYRRTCVSTVAEMRKSLAEADDNGFANSAHRLKGSTANFGQSAFVEKLGSYETTARKHHQIPIDHQDIDQLEDHLLLLQSQLSQLIQKWKSPNREQEL